jgi:hypothetical protein
LNQIGPGDVVQVVRGHDCDLGKTASVLELVAWSSWYCPQCKRREHGEFVVAITSRGPLPLGDGGYPLPWLRRFRPLGELIGEQRVARRPVLTVRYDWESK